MNTTANHRKQPPARANLSFTTFNPALPEDGALIIAAVLRDQFNGLNADLQTRATAAQLAAVEAGLQAQINDRATHLEVSTAMSQAVSDAVAVVLPQTPSSCNNVQQLSGQAPSYYDQYQMQAVLDKVNELIAALYRAP